MNDSKKLTAKNRAILRVQVEKDALVSGCGEYSLEYATHHSDITKLWAIYEDGHTITKVAEMVKMIIIHWAEINYDLAVKNGDIELLKHICTNAFPLDPTTQKANLEINRLLDNQLVEALASHNHSKLTAMYKIAETTEAKEKIIKELVKLIK